MAKIRLDDKTVRNLEAPGKGNRIDYDVPSGPRDKDFVRGFAVRTTAAGTKTFLLVYVAANGRERRQKIGDFGPFTATTARTAARKLRMQVDSGADPFKDAQKTRAEATRERALEGATFGGMLTAYVEALRRQKKPSAQKVEAELLRTVKAPFPALWRAPAADVTIDDLVRVTNRLVRAGKLRQAEKTRSYLRAAFTAASRARGSASTADLFEAFGHVENIARDLGTIERPKIDAPDEQGEKTGKRALSVDELAAYWRRIREMPGAQGAVLRLHLLTGAQRCEQLARLAARGIDGDAKTMTLWDSKGRRQAARRHVVPLIPDALAAVDTMAGGSGFAFTLDGGKHGAGYHAVRSLVARVAADMVDAGEVGRTFTPGELRITVETRLQAAGVSEAVRAHLQSHGMGGIQNRFYAMHDFAAEKRAALERLRAILEPGGKVVPLRRSRA
ncbi:integrase arm-type DNA-binding domain-containing protein [Dokdonella immobilis]|uniref:Integrase DNA-binding domain-containing protein n=1 Tax=Dokdonella immobilis TaxID=578942 RepID=A0A1I4ZUG7_9GAMM|nr:integrase arm-type DNA-binding domain-containing protein [Dokdonella immobilis]SFN53916.1 protein of unknown function [Dokdonella immobilis]